jgi:hypothetical protein
MCGELERLEFLDLLNEYYLAGQDSATAPSNCLSYVHISAFLHVHIFTRSDVHTFTCSQFYTFSFYAFTCAVLKINKKFISRLTRSKHTPSAAATVQVFYALIIILQCIHPGSQDTHPHDNGIRPIQYVYVVVSICGMSDPALLENMIE